jgi:hypothetical protein
MDANAYGSSIAEWSESFGYLILHEDLGTVEAPLDSIDSACERAFGEPVYLKERAGRKICAASHAWDPSPL